MLVDPRPALRRAAISTVAAVALATLLALPPASAAPVYPSQEQVDGAKAAVADTATLVAGIEQQLAEASARLEEKQVAAALAGEDYNQAMEVLAEKTAAADTARQAADTARVEVEAARVAVGRLAATAYRGTGDLAGLQLYLDADGPQELLDKAAAVDQVSDRRQDSYDRMDAAQKVATLLDAQATVAQEQQAEAAAEAERARIAAEQAQAAAEAEVVATEATRGQLVAQLAQLRQTSVVLEQQRTAGLEAERIARAEAAARAEAERREAAARAEADARARAESDARAAAESQHRAAADAAAPRARQAPAADPEPAPARPAPARPAPAPPAPAPGGSSNGSASAGEAAVQWAKAQVGKPYLWGATGPNSFDCSGLTSQAWQKAGGQWIGRTSRDQYARAEKIPYSQMRPGDLIFWGSGTTSSIHHVAMYAGGGTMVEAPRAGVPVRVTSVRMSGTMPYAGRP